MKPGKLYLKIFISFCLVLIASEIVIFALFIIFSGRHWRDQIERYTQAKVMMTKEVVEDKIRSSSGLQISDNESLRDFLARLQKLLGAKIWLAAPDGKYIIKPFEGEVHVDVKKHSERHMRHFGKSSFYIGDHKKKWGFYSIIPIENQMKEIGSLHVLFEKMGPPHPQKGFAIGLLIICIVVALLIIPVSRLISNPINRLRESAIRIAEGELSHRAEVKSRDEIGELGRSFNHMADQLERMIRGGRELTAHISHELRTPLARIRISEEMLREKIKEQDSQGLERHMDDIRDDIEELDDLIGRILMLSKLDIQGKSNKFDSLNPEDLLDELLERLAPKIRHKNLHVRTDLSFVPPFSGDREALHMVFSNILENAVKFSKENGEVAVEMSSEEKNLKIRITNSFEAMSEDDLQNIFEPFYRTEDHRQSGSGLGLAIVKKVIENHGGNVEALNATAGFQIRISLPQSPAEGTVP
ncbi:sensor histidine kinase [Thermodesulfobacteriota bacterium]